MNLPDLGGMAGKSSPDFLMRRLAALEAKVRQLETARSLEAATIGRGGITIASGGTLTLEGGDIVADGGDVRSGNFLHGVSGFNLDGTTGTPEFNDLILRGGIIGDDALQHPTKLSMNFADVNALNFTVAGANLAPATVTVPAGFTTAQVLCVANIGDSRAAGAGPSPIYGQAWTGKVGGTTSGSAVIAATCQDGSAMALSMGWASVITGLSGGDVVEGGAWAAVDTTTGWIANAGNAHSVVSVTFYR